MEAGGFVLSWESAEARLTYARPAEELDECFGSPLPSFARLRPGVFMGQPCVSAEFVESTELFGPIAVRALLIDDLSEVTIVRWFDNKDSDDLAFLISNQGTHWSNVHKLPRCDANRVAVCKLDFFINGPIVYQSF